MGLLKVSEILHWDPMALGDVFKIAQKRDETLQTFGNNILQVRNGLSEWKGATAEALHAAVGQARTDIESDGTESAAVARALATAETDIENVKRALRHQLDEAETKQIKVDDTGACSYAPEHPVTPQSMETLWNIQQRITATMVRAMTVDDEIAYAIRLAVTGVPVVQSDAAVSTDPGDGGTTSAAVASMIAFAKSIGDGRASVHGGVGPGYDCSGAQSAIYASLTGKPQGARYFTTDADFLALGFKKGYRPGAYNIGVHNGGGSNSHMAATLPNGVNFESGGAHDSTLYGGAAAGALDPQFENHYYLPVAGTRSTAATPHPSSAPSAPTQYAV